MPKRSRTSHIPSQVQRRKPRRTTDYSGALPSANPVSDEAAPLAGSTGSTATAVAPRVGRRLEAATRSRDSYSGRVIPGQLPTFERAYLIRELTQIAVISGSLLALLIVLWVVMR
jgi:hypothetical protein